MAAKDPDQKNRDRVHIELAILEGWQLGNMNGPVLLSPTRDFMVGIRRTWDLRRALKETAWKIPDYTRDLNAIARVEKAVVNPTNRHKYGRLVQSEVSSAHVDDIGWTMATAVSATAKQRAAALLRLKDVRFSHGCYWKFLRAA